ncbi:MAG: hypothetical protein AB8B91_19430 [Rubripirellula sp.]
MLILLFPAFKTSGVESTLTQGVRFYSFAAEVGQTENECAIAKLKSGETTEAFLVSAPCGHYTDWNWLVLFAAEIDATTVTF